MSEVIRGGLQQVSLVLVFHLFFDIAEVLHVELFVLNFNLFLNYFNLLLQHLSILLLPYQPALHFTAFLGQERACDTLHILTIERANAVSVVMSHCL